jgi:dTMP kinase
VKRGAFITLEGPEGCGKTTQIQRLAEQLRAAGVPVLLTREPGGTRTGEAIRQLLQHDCSDADMDPRTETLLFCASRAQIVTQVIRPALEQGTCVLCDRFTDSTLAYQGYGRGFNLDELRAMNRFATGGLVPDLTILLDVPVEESFRRLAARSAQSDRIERAAREFHERLRNGYLELAAAEPTRFHVLNSMTPLEQTSAEIWRLVQQQWGASHHAG